MKHGKQITSHIIEYEQKYNHTKISMIRDCIKCIETISSVLMFNSRGLSIWLNVQEAVRKKYK